jgi:hypothetical protein
MNNRVRELIKEHGSDSSGKWVAIDKVELIAELIVLKCAKIADTAEPFLSSDLIKQHFGVEE